MKLNRIQLKGVEMDKNKESIIKRYNAGVEIQMLAGELNVKPDTLCRRLKKWGVKIRRGDYKKKAITNRYLYRKFSPELQAKIRENTRINNKYIKFFNTVKTGNDKFLVRNILEKSRAVANE